MITHVRFAWEATVARCGKDSVESSSPARTQIQSTAVAQFHHANRKSGGGSQRSDNTQQTKGRTHDFVFVDTNLGDDAIHDVPVEHEPQLPTKLYRHLLLPLPPTRRQSGSRDAGRGTAIDTATHTTTHTTTTTITTGIRAAKAPRVVCSNCVPQSRGRAARASATATTARRLAIRQTRRRRRGCGCGDGGRDGGGVIAKQADIEGRFRERVLLREQCDLLHANICFCLGGRDQLIPCASEIVELGLFLRNSRTFPSLCERNQCERDEELKFRHSRACTDEINNLKKKKHEYYSIKLLPCEGDKHTLSTVAAGNNDVDKTRDNELTEVSPELVGSTVPND